jgi:hypothetical protein
LKASDADSQLRFPPNSRFQTQDVREFLREHPKATGNKAIYKLKVLRQLATGWLKFNISLGSLLTPLGLAVHVDAYVTEHPDAKSLHQEWTQAHEHSIVDEDYDGLDSLVMITQQPSSILG